MAIRLPKTQYFWAGKIAKCKKIIPVDAAIFSQKQVTN
jgi:hypothetical protein